MASLALGVVMLDAPDYLAVGVVASQATNAGIIVVASARRQPVRLKTDIANVEPADRHDVFPRAVTLPAKTGYFFRGKFGQILHHGSL